MKVYMISQEEMETIHSLRGWLSEIIKNGKLAKSQHHAAADFAIDLSEIMQDVMCAELQVNDT
jgi:imidazoleglycerol phosphate dehydratase HisB